MQSPYCCLWLRMSLNHSPLGVEMDTGNDCSMLDLFLSLSASSCYVQL